MDIESDSIPVDLDSSRPPVRPSVVPSSPPLPPSPISNPSTPVRKRPRTASWRPPSHVPEFLPPFPTDSPRHSPSPAPLDLPELANPVKIERPPTPPPQAQISSSVSSGDYHTPVPFSQSTLGIRPWDLPPPTPPSPPPSFTPARLPVPQTQPSLLGAYHHVLTHPPPPNVTSVNPARYKVALAFLTQSEVHPRWEPAATLFSSSAPNMPRVAPIGPSCPIPIVKGPPTPSEKDKEDPEKDRKPTLPSAPPRPVISCERLSPLISQQASRLPKLARQLLPVSVQFSLVRYQLTSNLGFRAHAHDTPHAPTRVAARLAAWPAAKAGVWSRRKCAVELKCDNACGTTRRSERQGCPRREWSKREGSFARDACPARRAAIRDMELRTEAA